MRVTIFAREIFLLESRFSGLWECDDQVDQIRHFLKWSAQNKQTQTFLQKK